MNSGNSKTPGSDRLSLNLSDKMNLKTSDQFVVLSSLSIYYPLENIKNLTKIINLSAVTWNKEFELLGGSYVASSIQEYVLKNMRQLLKIFH